MALEPYETNKPWDGKHDRRSTNPFVDVLNDRLTDIDERIGHIESQAVLSPETATALKQMATFWNGSRLMSEIIIGISALGAAVAVIGGGIVFMILWIIKRGG